MVECSSSNDVLSRIGCILTYGGERNDILINYALFILNTVWCYFTLLATTTCADRPPTVRGSYYCTHSTMSLVFIVAFQVVLCLIFGCSGISIVWCAQAGWILHQRYHAHFQDYQTREVVIPPITEIIVLVVGVLAILYYAVTVEAITTVAHVCALVLGSLLSLLVTMRAPRNDAEIISRASSTAHLTEMTNKSL
jgi:hypothetical protein